jgi:hypothetical protein
MTWNPIESLASGRLALLTFDGAARGRWIGYVNKDGICEWPAQVEGLKPSGWRQVTADPGPGATAAPSP